MKLDGLDGLQVSCGHWYMCGGAFFNSVVLAVVTVRICVDAFLSFHLRCPRIPPATWRQLFILRDPFFDCTLCARV